MRSLGMVLLTGAAAVIVWKILTALLFGVIGMALKVALVILLVYVLLRILNGNKDRG
jgi:predicted membrane protein